MQKKIISLFAAAAFLASSGALSVASAQNVTKSGSFRGAGGHQASGGVSVVKKDGTTQVIFSSNFRFDGAPDPRVAFGTGKYKKGTIFAKLRKKSGSQTYTVPQGLDVSSFSQVWLWCKKFNSPLAVASIN